MHHCTVGLHASQSLEGLCAQGARYNMHCGLVGRPGGFRRAHLRRKRPPYRRVRRNRTATRKRNQHAHWTKQWEASQRPTPQAPENRVMQGKQLKGLYQKYIPSSARSLPCCLENDGHPPPTGRHAEGGESVVTQEARQSSPRQRDEGSLISHPAREDTQVRSERTTHLLAHGAHGLGMHRYHMPI